jgi:hypothetical protein
MNAYEGRETRLRNRVFHIETEREHLADRDLDGKKILKHILKKYCLTVWFCGGFLLTTVDKLRVP